MTNLRYEKLTYELRGLIFEVRQKLKTGWPEEVYHQGMVQLLLDKDIPVRSKPRKTIVHRGVDVHVFECDLIVWDLIILELKVLPFTTFVPGHYGQIIHYLKCWAKNLGLLVNFGPTRAEVKRVVWDEPELQTYEDYDSLKPYMADAERSCLSEVRRNIRVIGQQYGLGYPETMYRKIAVMEMNHSGLRCQAGVEIPARLDNRLLAHHASDYLLVEGNFLLNIHSLLDHPPEYDFAQTKTYLNSLGLKFGLIVNFGKKQLQVYGVNSG